MMRFPKRGWSGSKAKSRIVPLEIIERAIVSASSKTCRTVNTDQTHFWCFESDPCHRIKANEMEEIGETEVELIEVSALCVAC